jgi:autotransporter-associated beta strand protein
MRTRNRSTSGQLLLALSLLILHLSPAISHAIEFEFLYTDPAGQGFFNPVDGAQRRDAMDFAGDIIGQLIRPTYADEVVTVRVNSYSSTTDNLYASATPAYYYGDFGSADPRYQSGTNYAKALASHLLGHEIQGDHDDITLNVNSANTFYWGTDGKSTPGAGDFVSIATHELIHGLGFADSFRAQGGYGLFGDGTFDSQDGVSGLPLAYDRLLTVSPGGAPLISLSSANRAGALTSNNIYWNGANAVAGNGGMAPKLFAPNPFIGGTSITHVDDATYPNDLMNSAISPGEIKQTPSAIDRGILRDLGWDISVSSSTVTWTGAGADNHLSNFANLSQQPYPGDALRFTNNAAGVFDVRMDLPLYQLERITFAVAAPAYTLRIDPTVGYDLTGFGVENQTALVHNFVLESQVDEASPSSTGVASYIGFRNSATSSNSSFDVHGGFSVAEHSPTDLYKRFNGAQVNFYNTANAGTSTFTIHGAGGDGAPETYGRVSFFNTSSAASAKFTTQPGVQGQDLDGKLVAGFGGRTLFFDTSSAATASISNLGQNTPQIGGSNGVTEFHDNTSAANASIHNLGATNGTNVGIGGETQFYEHASAGHAMIVNDTSTFSNGGGNTFFGDDSTAGNATIDNLGPTTTFGPGTTTFGVHSTAGQAVINNHGLAGGGHGGLAGLTSFLDDSSAGSASIHNLPDTDSGGRTEFHQLSSAANANIILDSGAAAGGMITFFDDSTAASAHLDGSAFNANGMIAFHQQATAANSVITLGSNNSGLNCVFYDSASAGSATISVGSNCNLQFNGTSSAVSANVTVGSNGRLVFNGDTAGASTFHVEAGGAALFSAGATAGSSTFIVDGSATGDAAGATLAFNGADPGASTIFLNSPTGPNGFGSTLVFNNATGPLTRAITQAGSVISVVPNDATALGSVDGAGGVSLGSTCILTIGGLGLTNTISGPITGFNTAGISKTGAADLTLSGHNSYKGLTSVLQGTLIIAGPNALPGPYFVAPGAHIVFGAPLSATSLTGTGTYTLNAPITVVPGSGLSTLTTLTLGPGGSLDLSSNSLTVSTATTPSSTIVGYLKSGFNAGLWNGVGINSSAAHNNAASLTALGYLDDGANVTIKYTYYGDDNLDGKVDATDFQMLLDGLVAPSATSWTQGDYTYDGRVDLGNDFNLFLTGYLNQGGALGELAPLISESNLSAAQKAQLQAVVPEPALGLAGAAALLALKCTRRRRIG